VVKCAPTCAAEGDALKGVATIEAKGYTACSGERWTTTAERQHEENHLVLVLRCFGLRDACGKHGLGQAGGWT
jgi:hypothetical protein